MKISVRVLHGEWYRSTHPSRSKFRSLKPESNLSASRDPRSPSRRYLGESLGRRTAIADRLHAPPTAQRDVKAAPKRDTVSMNNKCTISILYRHLLGPIPSLLTFATSPCARSLEPYPAASKEVFHPLYGRSWGNF